MNSYQDILPSFQDTIEKCENMASVTRASNLQESAIDDLANLKEELTKHKITAISSQDNDNANAFLSLECATMSLLCKIKMWLLIKQENPDSAWNELVNAQEYAISAMKAHEISSHLENYCERLNNIEKTIFPPQLFFSTGLVSNEEYCNICNEAYDECDHLSGKAYMGKMCHIQVKGIELNEISVVKEPADKHCRVIHFSDSEGQRNRMTWLIETEIK